MAPKKARVSAADKAAARAARSNAPTAEEMNEYLDRLHEINDRAEEDNATHMADMGSVYEEAAKELDMPKEAIAAAYKQDRKERKAAKKMAKADSRTRDAMAKIAQAYGDDSPLGQWASRMAAAATTAGAGQKDEE